MHTFVRHGVTADVDQRAGRHEPLSSDRARTKQATGRVVALPEQRGNSYRQRGVEATSRVIELPAGAGASCSLRLARQEVQRQAPVCPDAHSCACCAAA